MNVATGVIRSEKVAGSLDEFPSDLRSEVKKAATSGQFGRLVVTKTVSDRQPIYQLPSGGYSYKKIFLVHCGLEKDVLWNGLRKIPFNLDGAESQWQVTA